MNWYNEHDPFAAAWLRELMNDGHIPLGLVDERDIRDVLPSDLAEYTQCHFFAGIGGWSHALRLAGWPDDRPVWTGSCPCQPFSAAGRGAGVADERHLWPAFFHLIDACRPDIVMGEQVASKDGLAWLDLVHADLEGAGYTVRAVDTCAASVSAPHIRQRLWFVADADGFNRSQVHEGHDTLDEQRPAIGRRQQLATRAGASGGVRDGLRGTGSDRVGHHGRLAERGREGRRQVGADVGGGGSRGEAQGLDERPLHGGDVELADCIGARLERRDARALGHEREAAERSSEACPFCGHDRSDHDRQYGCNHDGCSCDWRENILGDAANERYEWSGLTRGRRHGPPDPSNTHWAELEWLPCRDGKARPTQPGIQPLASGVPNRVGFLRGAGNSIVPQVAAEVIKAFCD